MLSEINRLKTRPKMVEMMMMMGHECKWGRGGEGWVGREAVGGERKGIPRVEQDQSMLHVYI
jgi:hypothetical protein